MVKYLKECKVGDRVRLWCIGWRAWDDVVVKILDNGVSTLIKVEYPSGRTGEFVPTTECIVDRMYRPTYNQWRDIELMTEFISEYRFNYHQMELINFKTSKIHLKSGKRISFDCLSEEAYLKTISGEFYEYPNLR